MRSGKIFGIALAAAVALLGAVAMSAFGAAELKLVNGATYPQSILSSSSHVSKLVTAGGTEVACETLLDSGTLHSPTDLLLLLLWHKCASTGVIKAACSSPNEPSGLIHVLTLVLFGLLLNHLPGVLFELDLPEKHTAEFSCSIVKVTVNGTVLGHIISPAAEKPSSELTVDVNVATAGTAQTFTHFEGSESIDLLESSTGGAFEMSTEEVTEDHGHFVTAGVEAEFVG
jgi:hypothetical protein